MPRLSKAVAIERMQKLKDQIPRLQSLEHGSPEFSTRHRDARIAIENIFGEHPNRIDDFKRIFYSPIIFTSGTPDSAFQNAYVRGLDEAAAIFRSMINEIEESWEDDHAEVEVSQTGQSNRLTVARRVFLIHGRMSSSSSGTLSANLVGIEFGLWSKVK